MKKLKFILLISLLTFGQHTFACDCASQGEFLIVAPKAELVALVKVTKYLTFKDIYGKQTPLSMEVEVIDIYKGKETRKKITVWGDNGILCRPYLSQFDTGKYYVIAFYKEFKSSNDQVHKEEKASNYFISSCGDYWLNADMKNQIANGSVTNNQTHIKLTEIKNKIEMK